MTCGTTGDGYVHDPTAAQSTFSEGDRVCFKIRVAVPRPTWPPATPASATSCPRASPTSRGRPPRRLPTTADFTVDESTGNPLFLLGDTRTKPTFRFVPRGAIFEVVLSAIVGAPAGGPGTRPDREPGEVRLRHVHRHRLAARRGRRARSPHLRRSRSSRASRTSTAARPTRPTPTTSRCAAATSSRSGSTSTTTALPANDNAVDVLSPDVWDVLPIGITCADISAISDGGACTDPGDPTQPTFSGSGTHSAIRWQLRADSGARAGSLAHADLCDDDPGGRERQHVVPEHRGRAVLRDRDQPPRRHRRAPAAGQRRHLDRPARLGRPAGLRTTPRCTRPSVSLDKTNLTDITEPNNGPNQAVVGETLTYTLQLRVPAHTSVFNGVLTDPMPTGITYLSSSATFSATNTVAGHRPAAGRVHARPGERDAALPGRATSTTPTPRICSRCRSAHASARWPATRRAIQRVNTSRFNSQSRAGARHRPAHGDRQLDRHRRRPPDHAHQGRRRRRQRSWKRVRSSPTRCGWSARPAGRRPTTCGSSTACPAA